jgi:hypothetical protein
MGHPRFMQAAMASVFAAMCLPNAAGAQQVSPPPADGPSASGGHPSSSSASPPNPGVRHPQPTGSDAILPGFEVLADGSTRLFVELSRPVTYETKVGRGSITYILKDARIERRNNLNPLVTVHFNTPVTRARLVPHGHDVWFVVELRSAVHPAVAMDAGKDGGAMMRIEFPKGDYLPVGSKGDRAPSSSGDPGNESVSSQPVGAGR